MKVQILKQDIKDLLLQDDDLKLKLAKVNHKKIRTIEEWRRTDDPMLTTATNLELIRDHFAIPESELLTETVEFHED